MSIFEQIKKKGTTIIKNFQDEDPFAVSIDDYDDGDVCTEKSEVIIPPGDDGYGDDEEELTSKI